MGQVLFVLVILAVIVVGVLILVPGADWGGEARENAKNFWDRLEDAAEKALQTQEPEVQPVVLQ